MNHYEFYWVDWMQMCNFLVTKRLPIKLLKNEHYAGLITQVICHSSFVFKSEGLSDKYILIVTNYEFN